MFVEVIRQEEKALFASFANPQVGIKSPFQFSINLWKYIETFVTQKFHENEQLLEARMKSWRSCQES